MRVPPDVRTSFKKLFGPTGQNVWVYIYNGDLRYRAQHQDDSPHEVDSIDPRYTLVGRLDLETGEVIVQGERPKLQGATPWWHTLLKLLLVVAKIGLVIASIGAFFILAATGVVAGGHGSHSRRH